MSSPIITTFTNKGQEFTLRVYTDEFSDAMIRLDIRSQMGKKFWGLLVFQKIFLKPYDAKLKKYPEGEILLITTKDSFGKEIVAGGVSIVFSKVYFKGKPVKTAYIYDLRVDNKFQRRGFGTILTEQCEVAARKFGCQIMNLSVNRDPRAIQLYEKNNFVHCSHREIHTTSVAYPSKTKKEPMDSSLSIEKITSENKEGLREYTECCKNIDFFPVDISDLVERFQPYFEGLHIIRETKTNEMLAGVCLFYDCIDNRMALTKLVVPMEFWDNLLFLMFIFLVLMLPVALLFFFICSIIGHETGQMSISVVLGFIWLSLASFIVKKLILLKETAHYHLGKSKNMRAIGEFCNEKDPAKSTRALKILRDHVMTVAKKNGVSNLRFNTDKRNPLTPVLIPNFGQKSFETHFMVKFLEPGMFSEHVLSSVSFLDPRGI